MAMLVEVVARLGWVWHAYSHLVVETPDRYLSKGMRKLSGVLTQASNLRRGRTRHLFEGRFKLILADKDSYLLECRRFVVPNPVRAGMVKCAADRME